MVRPHNKNIIHDWDTTRGHQEAVADKLKPQEPFNDKTNQITCNDEAQNHPSIVGQALISSRKGIQSRYTSDSRVFTSVLFQAYKSNPLSIYFMLRQTCIRILITVIHSIQSKIL